MYKVALALACISSICAGRRVETHLERSSRSALSDVWESALSEQTTSESHLSRFNTTQALASLLLTSNPIAAFSPGISGTGTTNVPRSVMGSQERVDLRLQKRGARTGSKLWTAVQKHQRGRLASPRMAQADAEFNATTATLAAGFAFEVYNEPSENDARWERGADGIDVAFLSEDFAREVYDGILEVRLCEARDLSEQKELAQMLVSGSKRDPYVILAMNEENEEGPKEGAIGLGRAVDRVRSSTVWSKSIIDELKDGRDGGTEWPEDEKMYLYVKDPSRAQLALTVFDEEVLAEDIALGATSVHMADLLKPNGTAKEREWSGWVPLTWRPAETQDNTVMIGTVAGAALGGPLGAAAGGFVGSLIKKPVQGELRLELKYTPLREHSGSRAKAPTLPAPALSEEDSEEGAVEPWSAVISSGVAKGGSEGIDWSILSKRVGVIGEDEKEGYELCCFLTHRDTSSEVAIWRRRSERLLVVSFRGTSDILDVLTDVNFIQTPLEQGYQGQKSDDSRRVHSGFFASARAINRRLKELLVDACAGTPGEWQLLITGHSLGGALASLMAPDLTGQVDTSRGFKERPDSSWWGLSGKVKEMFASATDSRGAVKLPEFGTVQMYTFGAPRVGNSAFAEYFNEAFGPAAFRIVNDRDVVPRLPRDSKAGGALMDYDHVGRAVFIAEDAGEANDFDGFWVEGSSDEDKNPLRDASPLSNPFSEGNLAGDVGKSAVGFAQEAWSKIDKAAKVKSRSQLRAALEEAGADLARTSESISDRVKQVSSNPFEAVSLIGLDKDFVQSEVKLAESLANGKGIEHHLEPSYFEAMRVSLDAALGKDQ